MRRIDAHPKARMPSFLQGRLGVLLCAHPIEITHSVGLMGIVLHFVPMPGRQRGRAEKTIVEPDAQFVMSQSYPRLPLVFQHIRE